jgi:anti-sigma-K factor RskA
MNYGNPQLLDELAAQYALGTLRGAARQRFETLCRKEPSALAAVHRWEDRLLGLLGEIKPVAPPSHVWQRVQQRLGHRRTEQRGVFEILFGWMSRPQLAIAAGLAAVVLTVAVVTYIATPSTVIVATIDQWRIDAPKDHAKLSISRLATVALDPNRDYELWALPDSGAAPVSLGLMPKTGKRDLALNAAQRLALAGASKIAVSREPLGGSPNGSPTEVLFVANVTRA